MYISTGTGASAPAAARTGAPVVALDLSLGLLTVAQRLSPRSISFVRGDASLLPFASRVDADRGREVIAGSRLASVEVITRRLTGTYQSAGAAVEWALAWPLTAEGCDQLPSAACEALVAVEASGQLEWYHDVRY